VRQKTLIDVAAFVALVTTVSSVVRAQTPMSAKSVTVGPGVIIMPRIAGDCGGGGGGFEGNGSLILRSARHFLVEAGVHAAHLWTGDCAGTAKEVDTAYVDVHLTPDPYLTSSLKLGYETPAPLPLFRLTAGAGALWGGRPSAFFDFGLAWSTRGPRGRLFVEMEQTRTRIRGVERHYDLVTQQLNATRPFHIGASTESYRIGLEWPLSGTAR
jgi:hypothetical protein